MPNHFITFLYCYDQTSVEGESVVGIIFQKSKKCPSLRSTFLHVPRQTLPSNQTTATIFTVKLYFHTIFVIQSSRFEHGNIYTLIHSVDKSTATRSLTKHTAEAYPIKYVALTFTSCHYNRNLHMFILQKQSIYKIVALCLKTTADGIISQNTGNKQQGFLMTCFRTPDHHGISHIKPRCYQDIRDLKAK